MSFCVEARENLPILNYWNYTFSGETLYYMALDVMLHNTVEEDII